VFNFADEFTRAVVDPYVDGYSSGTTPNPCVECNRSIKFGRLLDRALALGFDRIATGHHARIRELSGELRVCRGADAAKDQSYVLAVLGQRELAHTLLPVGELTKAEVRARAAELGLRTAAKAESMDVCFIPRRGRSAFLDARVSARPGAVVESSGREVGRHEGVEHFTVGQRRGVGVAVGERRYVIDVDAAHARVTIGTRDDLLRDEVALRDLQFTGAPADADVMLTAQTRAHSAPVPATLSNRTVHFAAPQPRVAPGQIVALYDGDAVVACGIAT
jgi:tRNA-specific 2-thiouridylase